MEEDIKFLSWVSTKLFGDDSLNVELYEFQSR